MYLLTYLLCLIPRYQWVRSGPTFMYPRPVSQHTREFPVRLSVWLSLQRGDQHVWRYLLQLSSETLTKNSESDNKSPWFLDLIFLCTSNAVWEDPLLRRFLGPVDCTSFFVFDVCFLMLHSFRSHCSALYCLEKCSPWHHISAGIQSRV